MVQLQLATSGLCFFVVLMCLKSAFAIECYDCNSYTDKRCIGDANNKLDDELKKQCPQQTAEGKPYKLCRKIKQMIDFEVNGMPPESRIIRTCGWDDSSYKNRCYQRSGFGGRQEVCACDGNNCNSSTSIIASVSLLTIMIVLNKIYH